MDNKISKFVNQLNDLKISANDYLDKYHKTEKEDMLEERIEKIRTINSFAEGLFPDEVIEDNESLVKNICQWASDTNKSPEECILEVGLYALAFDKMSKDGE